MLCAECEAGENNDQRGDREGNRIKNSKLAGPRQQANYEWNGPSSIGTQNKFDITPHCDGNDEECAVEL